MAGPLLQKTPVNTIVWSAGAVVLIAGLLALSFGFNQPVSGEDASEVRKFLAIYEPSGVQSLPDGRLIVVEDEASNPLHVLSHDDSLGFTSKSINPLTLADALSSNAKAEKFDDLEGVAVDRRGYVYAITSHSRTGSGKRKKKREKLIRFRMSGDEISELQSIDSLYEAIAGSSPLLEKASRVRNVKDDNGLNVEALAFDKSGERLLIGLRSPVIDKQGVVVIVENPHDIFERGAEPMVAEELLYLDLEKGGLRALTYDRTLDGYLVVSRREDKKGKAFKLWLWKADGAEKPRRIKIQGVKSIKHAEGITSFVHGGTEKLLIAYDDGNALRRIGAHYRIVDYADLTIEQRN